MNHTYMQDVIVCMPLIIKLCVQYTDFNMIARIGMFVYNIFATIHRDKKAFTKTGDGAVGLRWFEHAPRIE